MAVDPLLAVANRALFRLGAKSIVSLDEDTDRARVCQAEAAECRQETLRAFPWNFARKRALLNGLAQTSVVPSIEALTVDALATFTTAAPIFVVGQDEGARLIGTSGGLARIATVTDTQTVTARIEAVFPSTAPIAAEQWRLAPGWEWEFRYPKPAGYLRLAMVQGVSLKNPGSSVLWSWWRDLKDEPEPVKIEDQFLVSNAGAKLHIAYTQDVADILKWDALSKSALAAQLAYRICYAVTGSLQASKTQHDAFKEILAEARTMDSQEGSLDNAGSDILLTVRW